MILDFSVAHKLISLEKKKIKLGFDDTAILFV